MKIIASRCEVPGLNVPGVVEFSEKGLRHTRYTLAGKTGLPQWAASVCRQMLEDNGIAPDQIGVIIGTSISLAGTTAEGNSAAPGICHSVQRALAADKAFVFDLFHTDWCTALEIGNAFLQHQSCRYGLVVKAENFQNFSFDSDSGFALPDAASALLFEADADGAAVQRYHLEDIPEAGLRIVPNRDIANTTMQFAVRWNCSPEEVQRMKEKLAGLKEAAGSGADLTITENWFDGQGNGKMYLGMHYLPWCLQQEQAAGHKEKNVQAILFNPFLLEYTTLNFSI